MKSSKVRVAGGTPPAVAMARVTGRLQRSKQAMHNVASRVWLLDVIATCLLT
jgi:hypothetical protein